MDPRAATGTLDELLLLAAFTNEDMLGTGVCPRNDAESKSKKSNTPRVADHLVLPWVAFRRQIPSVLVSCVIKILMHTLLLPEGYRPIPMFFKLNSTSLENGSTCETVPQPICGSQRGPYTTPSG
jgi:hypothetical protein